MAKWCLYALGGGLGHLTRSLALARAALARGDDVTLLANSPYAELLPVADELGNRGRLVNGNHLVSGTALAAGESSRNFERRLPVASAIPLKVSAIGRLVSIPPAFNRDQVAEFVRRSLTAWEFDVLVVDTFPRGLAGELAELLPGLPGTKVLVHRDLNPRYVEQADLARFVTQFDLILSPGEFGPLADQPQVHSTAPWLIRNHDELLDQAAAWELLRITDTHLPVIAVIASGFPSERQSLRELAARLSHVLKGRATVRLIALDQSSGPLAVETVSLWPCLSAIRGIDLLVGAGGYNTVWEARATGTPLLAIARPRLYDRQDVRLESHERVANEAEAQQRVLAWVAQAAGHRQSVSVYVNGVPSAIQRIEVVNLKSNQRSRHKPETALRHSC